jgi:hypothetical protein
MKDNNITQDDFFKKLVGETKLESPSVDFTKRVMLDIENLSSEPVSITGFLISKIWYLILAVMIVVVIAGVLYFTPGSREVILKEYRPLLFDIPQLVINNFRNLFSSVKLSSVTVVILISIASVFAADQFIRKPGRRSYML